MPPFAPHCQESARSDQRRTRDQGVRHIIAIVQVSSLGANKYAIKADGTMYEWGANSTDPDGPGVVVDPRPVWGIDHVRSMVTGSGFILAIVE